jgi:hypothetical protein
VRGKHTVLVDILYSATRLNIKYRDSTDMSFKKDDESPGLIHPNYNVWVDDFLQAIMFEIQKLDSISMMQKPSQKVGNFQV